MNKNLIALVGLFLVGIIAYQAYLLGKKEALRQPVEKEPEITVTIDDNAFEKEVKIDRDVKASQLPQSNSQQPLVDEQKIKDDLNRLFKDIFANPKMKEEINKNLSQFQQQLQEGMNQFQKEMFKMTQEFEKAAKNDTFLKDFFKNLNFPKTLSFTDLKDRYYLKTQPIADENSTIDIKVKGDFMLITVNKLLVKNQNRDSAVIKKEIKEKKRILVTLPKDADISKLKTKYKDSSLEITVPKKKI